MNQPELNYFRNGNNLDEILLEHPQYFKIYFKTTLVDGKVVVSLSREETGQLYCVSNTDHKDLKQYLKKQEVVEIKVIQEKAPIIQEPVKRMKQQSLFSFFSKNNNK